MGVGAVAFKSVNEIHENYREVSLAALVSSVDHGPWIDHISASELPRIIRLFDYSNSWDRIVLFGIRYSLILR